MSEIEAITKDRTATYSPFHQNAPHACAIFRAMRQVSTSSGFGPYDDCLEYALWMIATKVSRLAASPTHRDSIVDIAGYAKVLLDARDHYEPAIEEAPDAE